MMIWILIINEDVKFSSIENEDCTNVAHNDQTKPIIPNKSAYMRVGRTEVVSGDTKFICQDYERIFNNQNALLYHTKSKNKGIKYACNQCYYQALTQSSLKLHIQHSET